MKNKRKRYRFKPRFWLILCVVVVFIASVAAGVYFLTLSEETKAYTEAELQEMGIPESLIDLYMKNEDARDFVLGYMEERPESGTINISKDVKRGEIPLFFQWDKRWGYENYGDDVMALEGCGPTCLSMVYCGLTGDEEMHPLAVARLSEEGNHYVSGVGSAWTLMQDLAVELGLEVEEVFFMADSIVEELQAGRPIICAVGPGDFTTMGHFIVLTDADNNGMVTVHDPNSKKNSRQKWDVERIMSQTENLWSYSVE